MLPKQGNKMHPGVIAGWFRQLGLERLTFVNLCVISRPQQCHCLPSAFLPSPEAYRPRNSQQNSLCVPASSQTHVLVQTHFHQTSEQRCQVLHRNGLRHKHFSLCANFAMQMITSECEQSEEGWEEEEKHPKIPS